MGEGCRGRGVRGSGYLAPPTTTMPMLAALEEELLVFCSRELGRAARRLCRYCSGISVLTENLSTFIHSNYNLYTSFTFIADAL